MNNGLYEVHHIRIWWPVMSCGNSDIPLVFRLWSCKSFIQMICADCEILWCDSWPTSVVAEECLCISFFPWVNYKIPLPMLSHCRAGHPWSLDTGNVDVEPSRIQTVDAEHIVLSTSCYCKRQQQLCRKFGFLRFIWFTVGRVCLTADTVVSIIPTQCGA